MKIIKFLIAILASFLAAFILLNFWLDYRSYDLDDAIENYELNSPKIEQLMSYYSSIVPHNHLVTIEFNSETNINLEVYIPTKNDSSKRELLFRERNIDIYEYTPSDYRSEYDLKYGGRTNSFEEVKEVLGWDIIIFETFYKYLKAANCISIVRIRDFYSIGFQRNYMTKYSYRIYDQHLTYDLQKELTNDCNSLFYRDNVVLKYDVGVFGSTCSDEFKRD